MSFVVSSSDLKRHLAIVAPVVPNKAVVPIISNVHFLVKENQLIISANDLENAITTILPINNLDNQRFDVALSKSLLQSMLSALSEQPLTFRLAAESFQVTIHSDQGEYMMSGFSGAEFPAAAKAENTSLITLNLKLLQRALDKTAFAASTEEFKQNMNGVLFDLRTDVSVFVATDAHRLVRLRRTDLVADKNVSFILPLKSIKLISSVLSAQETDQLVLEYNERNAFFTVGHTTLSCRLVDAQFPQYERVIPTHNSKKATVNRQELVGCLRRIEIFASKTSHAGTFQLTGNVLTIQGEDIDQQTRARESLHCMYEGEDLRIGFDVKLLLEMLLHMDTDEVIFEMESPGKAAIILPNNQENQEHLLMLLMPIMLQS